MLEMVQTCPHCKRICLLPEFFEEHQYMHQLQLQKKPYVETSDKVLSDSIASEKNRVHVPEGVPEPALVITNRKSLPQNRSTNRKSLPQNRSSPSLQSNLSQCPRSRKSQKSSSQTPRSGSTNDLNCKYCRKKFDSQSKLIYHSFGHNKKFHCSQCDVAFQNAGEYEMHVLLHRLPKIDGFRECHKCHGIFSNAKLFHNHINISHMVDDKLGCRKCKISFTNIYYYQRHLLLHIGKSLHICTEFCGLVFDEEEALKKHCSVHISSNSEDCKDFQCHDCALSFCNEIKLLHHRYRFHGCQKPYPCDRCSQIFFKESLFNSHFCW